MKIITMPLGALQTNCYLVCDEASGLCAVIDPAAFGKRILERAQSEGMQIGAILLTHAHFDHTGGLKVLHEALPEVKIYICGADTDNSCNMSHGNLVYTDTYREGDEIEVGALRFAVLQTPGHTKGSVCLRCGEALFSGDTLFAGSCGRTDFVGGSSEEMMASLRRLALLSVDCTVYPGHGEATALSRERAYNPYLREAMQ